jgi:UDP-N-acetylmuramoylalanine--D-glutamate ligase
MKELKSRKIAVLGYGLEGKDMVSYLLGEGAIVTIFDKKSERELDLTQKVQKKTRLITGENYLSGGLKDFDIVFRSPGVYRYLAEIVAAEKEGVKISSAIKLFFDLSPAKIIGVTGTKGKGTTSTLIYKILKASEKDVYLAGNIGKPYLELLPKLKPSSWVVLELSSFQLIDLHKSPYISVVLNITVDHLDWHKDKKEYVNAKKSIVSHQKNSDFAVLNDDFTSSRNFSRYTKGRIYYFSKSKGTKGCFVEKGRLVLAANEKVDEIGNVSDLLLRGKHNWENVTAAICAARLAGASISSVKRAVFSFKGLEHRLELIGKVRGVSFYNDSFSTNPQTTEAAINSFDETLTLILGGYDKDLEYKELAKKIAGKKSVETIILIGDIAGKIKKVLNESNFKGTLKELGKKSMKIVVQEAVRNTPKGGIVLLSPATSSFDMFENYKERGNQFKEATALLRR